MHDDPQSPRHLAAIVAVLIGAFGFAVSPACDGTEEASETGEGGEADDCATASFAGVNATCSAATDEAACIAANEAQPCHACVWEDWVPTTLEPDGTCSYGPVMGACVGEQIHVNSVGCVGGSTACGDFTDAIVYRLEGTELQLLRAPYCTPPGDGACFTDADGTFPASLPPECACACAADFPGT
jgi:hypothetical protein